MKNRAGLRLILACAGFALAGCAGGEEEHAPGDPAEAEFELIYSVGADEQDPEDVRLGLVVDVALTPKGGLLVADAHSFSVHRFGPDGDDLEDLGGEGEGPGEFRSLGGVIVTDGGHIVAWDPTLGRMTVFDDSGELEDSWRVPERRVVAERVLFPMEEDGVLLRIFQPETPRDMRPRYEFVHFGIDGTVRDTLEMPRERASVPLVGADDGANDVPPFWPTPEWTVLKSGVLAWSHREEYRISLLNDDGSERTGIRRDTDPVPVRPGEAEAWIEAFTDVVQRQDPGWHWDGAEIPDEKPAIRDLAPTDDGNLLVRPHRVAKEVDGPDGSLNWSEPDIRHIYDEAGQVLGAIRAPEGHSIRRVRGDRLVTTSENPVGATQVNVFRYEWEGSDPSSESP